MEEKQCRVCGETKPLDAYSSWMRGEKVAEPVVDVGYQLVIRESA